MHGEGLPIGLPAKFEFHDRGSYIEIIRRWFGPHIIFLTAFVIFWDGFLVFWYSMAVKNQSLIPLVFPLLPVAVGAGLTYYVIAGYLNKTFIKADYLNISILHRPVPFFGNKTVTSADVRQLYSKERISHSRSETSASYHVQALTHSGETVTLLSGLETSEQALYIEQQIERFLNIEDKAVRGEISR